ncbi:uncharacterized protein LOC141844680 [Curcuma longa]|uniref:uncharacterized protein LOC141844680 n=1 Tax=Curcuma longa TaxID=136217 RepID=UPI003D9F9433
MNSSGSSSNRGARSSAAGASFDSYQFDFGVAGFARGSASRPIKDQKPTGSYGSASSATAPSWSYQPSRPSWTPAAAPSSARSGNINGPASMVGDIFGKSWASATPAAGIGIPKSDSNLFSDLVGSALGQGRGGSGNVPLNSAPPKNAVGSTATATYAASSTPIRPNSWGSADKVGNLSSFNQPGPKIGAPMSTGGQPMKSMGGMPKPDPFASLGGFGSNSSVKSATQSVNSSGMNRGNVGAGAGASAPDFSFGAFQNANSSGSFSSPLQPPPPNPPKESMDPLDSFFSSSAAGAPASEAPVSQQFSEMTDWDMASEFGSHDNGGPTTELEGLPPPPSGVTAPAAKAKGQDNYKQGQFADAIKWLSWAVVLLEKTGDHNSTAEVLSCRASCYKEVGEYKKAVADCSKVLEKDSENISMLVQRALLYESMEKYKLGAEDLRMVLKIDPGNRVARSTIHRLNKFAE